MTNIPTFENFHNRQCNVDANELKPGDVIKNINKDCDHFQSKGQVVKITKIKNDHGKNLGNLCTYKVTNNSDDLDPSTLNGTFKPGDILKKTEIQLKKINE